jgi:hypothetical protein
MESKLLVEQWCKEYNHCRPQSSLGYKQPPPETLKPSLHGCTTLRHEESFNKFIYFNFNFKT